ncbi:MAG: hypothetical protein D6695_01425 [Planctomycetota bacterium]|nr:MAG: hypothetical protein D6695_01425 [Planctomycetota bacterium]
MKKTDKGMTLRRAAAVCSIAMALCSPAVAQVFDEQGEPIPPNPLMRDRAQPAEATADGGENDALAQPEDQGESITFANFSEPVELSTLVDYVGSTLGINIVVKGTLSGTVMFNAPVDVPKSELLNLLDALLEQYDFSITQDTSGIYTVQPRANTPVNFAGERATSKIIDTAGLRPTGLQTAIQAVLGQAGAPGQAGQQSIAYVDELGVIVMTGTARDIARVEALIEELRQRYLQSTFSRIELEHVAAPVARERLIQLVGAGTSSSVGPQVGRQQQPPNIPNIPGGASGGALDNIADRLTVDAQSNALIFRGNDQELMQVLDVIRVIDVPNTMVQKQYFAGSAVLQIADLARQRGLGEVITLTDPTQDPFGTNFRINPQQQQQQFLGQQGQQVTGGPTMVVDERRQSIIYYGTPAQHSELAKLIELLDVGEDVITLEYYKLSNARAEDVAEIIQGLISGQSLTGESPLIPGGQARTFQQQFQQFNTPQGGEQGFAPDPTRVFVIADEANNQVIVKAPKKQQDEFGKLVHRLDLRRPQVYLEALIVAVSDSKDFRLAIESQLQAGQYQAQTNFGLGSPGTTFQDPRTVTSTLGGFTSALIRSDMVPFIINAVQNNSDSRILSTPQLLVNDNEQATIASIEQQPTVTRNIGQTSDSISFQGYEDAGTTLTATPTISEAGYIRLEYEVQLSNFIGTGTDGIPAPRADNTVTGIATIPSDATIVVGGISVDNTRNTVVKVPLLGDIPLFGHLFRDTSKSKSRTLLYIFITPRIMTDPNFQDLRLLTRGPQATAEINTELPPLSPSRIELAAPVRVPAREPDEADSEGLD